MHYHGIVNFLRYMSYTFLPCVFWLLVVFGFDEPYIAILTLIAAAIHESGHFIAIRAVSGKGARLGGAINGLRIRCPDGISHLGRIAILSAGIAFNLASAVILYLLGRIWGDYFTDFSYVNLATAVSNLLPEESYDGYGIVRELLEHKERSVIPLVRISFLFTVALTFLSLFFIGRYGSGYWIFFLFFSSLFQKISKMEKHSIF